jgi:hypothetical protein
MATSSTVTTVKAALLTRLSLRAGLAGVDLAYGWSGDFGLEAIFFGSTRGVHEDPVTTGGRIPRDERYTMNVIVSVAKEGGTPQDAEDRAFALLAEVENELADTPRLGLVNVIDWAAARDFESQAGPTPEGGLAEIRLGVEVFAQLQ